MLKRLAVMVLVSWPFACGPGLTMPALAQQSAEQDIFAPADGSAPGQPTARPQLPAQRPSKTAAAKAKLAAQVPKPNRSDAGATAASGESDADQRIGHLEEQIADLQVALGTIESMGKTRPGSLASAGATGAATGDLEVRVGQLETRMQVLGGQMAELVAQVRALNTRLPSGFAPLKSTALTGGASSTAAAGAAVPQQSALTAALAEPSASADTGFGQTTVTQQPGSDPAVQNPPSLEAPGQPDVNGSTQTVTPDAPQPGQIADLAPQTPASDPQTAYDQAYAHVLQQDYAGAELAFRDYLTRFPQTPLASNAHYWLGQTYYARGQYKPAADAFLTGYKTFRTGQKAPDSLLKVAMSLSRLGQKDMACSAFTALDSEFPNASVQVKHIAQTERERSGC